MQTAFLRWPRVAATWVLVAALAACGGGDGEDAGPEQPVVPVNPAGAGQLQSATLLGSIAATDIAQALQAQDSRIPDLVPRYDVLAYRLEYTTSDVNGQPIRASGLVGVPAKAAGAASRAWPTTASSS